ncbi:MAG: hypothetical protein ABID83_04970 [Candidatus Omnitrophota bacterium]
MEDEKNYKSLHERVEALKDQSLSGNTPAKSESSDKVEERIEKTEGKPQKPVVAKGTMIAENSETQGGPVGLDIGTSHIVVAQNKRNYVETIEELNAFFTVPNAKFAQDTLNQKKITYYEQENMYYIFGYAAESFANMFNTNTKRPMTDGFLSPNEADGLSVIQAIVNTLVQKPKKFGETLCFVIPGDPLDGNGSVGYHESVIKNFIGALGYSPLSINEGLAVAISELSEDDYSGIGISMGGGMCNICLSYLSFPVITYSLQIAGDYIDSMVGSAVGEPATKIKVIKEEELDLTREPNGRIITALHIFYNELIFKLLQSLERVLSSTENIPKIKAPVPIVISGGTAMPKGCKETFENMLKKVSLPVEISTVRLAEDPLNTSARGALVMALTEAG